MKRKAEMTDGDSEIYLRCGQGMDMMSKCGKFSIAREVFNIFNLEHDSNERLSTPLLESVEHDGSIWFGQGASKRTFAEILGVSLQRLHNDFQSKTKSLRAQNHGVLDDHRFAESCIKCLRKRLSDAIQKWPEDKRRQMLDAEAQEDFLMEELEIFLQRLSARLEKAAHSNETVAYVFYRDGCASALQVAQ